jgi:RNA polymerase-interacting CarD/CdnL/TRCF family regulator
MNTFKVGETVVHKTHGIGEIVGIEQRDFGKGMAEMYIMHIVDAGAPKKVFVPVTSANERLRKTVARKQGLEVLEYLKHGKPDANLDVQTWSRQFRLYMEYIHSGDLMNIAKVFVSLRNTSKELNFGERKLLEQAYSLLKKEFETLDILLEAI